MALVLRKAVAKHLTIMTCMKGRTFSTIAKRNPIPFSPPQIRRLKKRLPSKSNIRRTSELISGTEPRKLRNTTSCPNIQGIFSSSNPQQRSLTHLYKSKRNYSKSNCPPPSPCSCPCTCPSPCPCPHPCGPYGTKDGCSCLPPPCNVPPRSVQYMTGYYYYPYGTWFSGPYHVTGTCVPVSGPCPCPCPKPCCPPCPKPCCPPCCPPCPKPCCPPCCPPCPCPCPKCCLVACICPKGPMNKNVKLSGLSSVSLAPNVKNPPKEPKKISPSNNSAKMSKSEEASMPGHPFTYTCNSYTTEPEGNNTYLSKSSQIDAKHSPKVMHRKYMNFYPNTEKSNCISKPVGTFKPFES